jgi:hypothetical protein
MTQDGKNSSTQEDGDVEMISTAGLDPKAELAIVVPLVKNYIVIPCHSLRKKS